MFSLQVARILFGYLKLAVKSQTKDARAHNRFSPE